ncbi:uncharacterized protein [Coffea arabica]|uniref:Uncharacterized protein n=1 Tax=Coffea arabica TaxID=13443 RepID=A0A6P6S414_COFAR|nr:uncharacterized protein LOC113687530 [Coffea arabica]
MKNKFALCFRPVVLETEEPDPDDHDHNSVIDDVAVSKAIIVAKAQKKKNRMIPQVMSPSTLDGNGGNLRVPCFPLPKTHSRKTLPGVLKSILYETSPRMRVQNGKIRQLTPPEKTDDHVEESISPSVKVDDDKRVKFKKVKEANISEENEIISRISSSSSFSSSSTVSSSSNQSSTDFRSLSMKRALARSRSNSFDQKKRAKTSKPNDKTLDFSSSDGGKDKGLVFYWMVLSLLATILWGKIFAIPLASLWLYSIPRRRSGMEQRLPENKAGKLPEIEPPKSREYKKKIIMEGLLERKPLQQKALNF